MALIVSGELQVKEIWKDARIMHRHLRRLPEALRRSRSKRSQKKARTFSVLYGFSLLPPIAPHSFVTTKVIKTITTPFVSAASTTVRQEQEEL